MTCVDDVLIPIQLSNNWKIVYIWTINYDSLNKNTISLKLHKGTEKLLIIEFNFFGEEITILVHFFVQVLLTILAYKYCDHNVQDIHLLHSTHPHLILMSVLQSLGICALLIEPEEAILLQLSYVFLI